MQGKDGVKYCATCGTQLLTTEEIAHINEWRKTANSTSKQENTSEEKPQEKRASGSKFSSTTPAPIASTESAASASVKECQFFKASPFFAERCITCNQRKEKHGVTAAQRCVHVRVNSGACMYVCTHVCVSE